MGRCLVALTMVAALAPCSASAGDLAGADIERMLVGHSIRWWVEDSRLEGDLMLEPGGRAEIASESPSLLDEGRWRLSGDELCTTWREARSGVEKCYRVRQVAERRFVTTGGNVFELRDPGA